MSNDVIISLIVTGAIGTCGFIFRQTLQELIKKIFSNMTKQESNGVAIIAVTVIAIAGYFLANLAFDQDETLPLTQAEEQKNWDEMSDLERAKEIKDFGEEVKDDVGDIVQDLSEAKASRDNALIAERGEKWVFQIGDPFNDEDLLWDAYSELKELPNIYAFKVSRNQHLLVQDGGLDKEQLEGTLEALKDAVRSVTPNLYILELNKYCKAKHRVVQAKRIKVGKDKLIPCRECR